MTNLISISKLKRSLNVKLQHNPLSPKSLLVLLAALLLNGACGGAPDQCTEAAVKAEEERITKKLADFYTDNPATREYIKKKLADGRIDLEARSRLACQRAAAGKK
jgi:hypothetical protein